MQCKVQLNAMQSAKRCIAVDGSLLTYGARGIPNWSHCTRHRARLYCTQLRYLATHGHWSPFAIGHCGCLSLNARIYYQLKTEQGRTINATHFVTGMLPTQDDFLYVYVGQVGR